MRIALTGSSGFLGSALVRAIAQTLPDAQLLRIRRRATDAGPGPIYTEVPSADVLIHLGGGSGIAAADADPLADLHANATSTLELLEACGNGHIGRFVLVSSAAVYGRVQGLISEDLEPRPLSAYGVSKRAAELYVLSWAQRYDLDATIARLANPYGPGQHKLVVYDLAERALREGAPLRVRGEGNAVRDFLYVDDAARALLTVARNGAPGEVYNIGSGEPTTILELAGEVALAAGLQPDDIQPDGRVEGGKVSVFRPDVHRLQALGFSPQISLRQGVQQTVQWLADQQQ